MACEFLWLDTNAMPSVADIVTAMRAKTANTQEEWIKLCDDLDAAAKRAYERIDLEMSTSVMLTTDCLADDCMRIRLAMDETIGLYHTEKEQREW